MCGGSSRCAYLCEYREEGKVRQGHTKGRETLDGETGEETVKKNNGRTKDGSVDGKMEAAVGGMGESKNRKPLALLAWMAGQRPLPAMCWHISLRVQPETTHLHTMRSKPNG